MIKKKIRDIFLFFLNFLYPNICLHCSKTLKKDFFYFCEDCLNFFSFEENLKNENYCRVFEKNEVILTFKKELKRNHILSISKILAAFMVVQHNKLNYPMPDIIYPITKNMFYKDHVYYLAKDVSKFLKRPLKKKLKNLENIVLVIFDDFNLLEFSKIQEKFKNKKVFGISL